MQLELFLLGGLRVRYGEHWWPLKMLPKSGLLLGYLLIHRTTPINRDKLAFTFWPDATESEARANLRRHLYDIRQALPNDDTWIDISTRQVQWAASAPFWLDIAEFEAAEANPDQRAAAVGLYRGALLQGQDGILADEGWLLATRERLHQLQRSYLNWLGLHARASGDLNAAIGFTQQLLAHEPLREDTVRELMTLQYSAGDRTGALASYHNLVIGLRDEMGVDPMPETRALHTQILNEQPLPSPIPTKVEPIARGQLPVVNAELIGREQELAALVHQLHPSSQTQWVTLIGSPGVGKTRMALAVADQLAAEFSEGAVFVRLAAISATSDVVGAILRALGVSETAHQADEKPLAAVLQNRKVLLVLDNAEHVAAGVLAACEQIIGLPNLRILVTSRVLLNGQGEQEFTLHPLALPDLNLAGLETSSAVQLFVSRAQIAVPSFELTHENAPVVAMLCRQLDGLPLGLELAAARLRLVSLAELTKRLQNQIDFLATPVHHPLRPQATLSATIATSEALLNDAERALFARLAVFASSFTLADAEAVCGGDGLDDVASTLDGLLDASLVVAEPATPDDPRFRLLVPVQQYALTRLKNGTEAAWRGRHLAYYLTQAEQMKDQLATQQQASVLAWYDRAYPELQAALTFAVDQAESDLALRLATALGSFWRIRGHVPSGAALLALALALPNAHPQARADALLVHNLLQSYLGNYEPETYQVLDEAYALFLELKDFRGLARTKVRMGWVSLHESLFDLAEEQLQEGLTLYKGLGDVTGLATANNHLGLLAYYRGDLDSAEQYWTETVAFRRMMGDMVGLSGTINNIGLAKMKAREWRSAVQLHSENLSVRRALGHLQGIGQSLFALGWSLLALGQTEGVKEILVESLHLRQKLSTPGGVLESLEGLAWLASIRQEANVGVRLFGAAQSIRAQLNAETDDVFETGFAEFEQLSRAQLGDAEFEALLLVGRALPMTVAIKLAQDHFSD